MIVTFHCNVCVLGQTIDGMLIKTDFDVLKRQ
jgi:hypothetical protein